MFGDLERARDEAFDTVARLMAELRSDSTVEARYLDRLTADRDEKLAHLHFSLDVSVLELASRTGIPWPQVYDIVDAVRARKRGSSVWSFLTDPCVDTPVIPPKSIPLDPEPECGGDQ